MTNNRNENKNGEYGGIFDEVMLLAAKGLLLIIIISGLTLSIISVLEKFTSLLDIINTKIPE